MAQSIPAETSRTVIKGDATCQVIAAASILAKAGLFPLAWPRDSESCLEAGNCMPPDNGIPEYCPGAVILLNAALTLQVVRDRLMEQYDEQFPAYGFKQHKGYGTAQHMAALKSMGPCSIHRFSYKPVAEAAGLASKRERGTNKVEG